MKWRIISADIASGIISARKSAGGAAWTGIKDEELPGANFFIDASGDSTTITVQWENPRGAGMPVSYKKTRNKFFEDFFTRLAEALK